MISRSAHQRLLAALCLLAIALPELSQADSPPNLLVIVVDDMGYGDLSCYGSRQIKTPAIDALAASGVRFTQGYVSGSVCAPSRAGLMTGRYQNRFGFEHNLTYPNYLDPSAVGLPKSEVTFASRLQKQGYQTACIGKWHLGEHADWQHPCSRGFDYFFGMLNGNHNYFPTPKKNHLFRNREPIQNIEVPYLTDWFTEEAIRFIDNTDPDRPWLLYLAYNTPHTPLQAKVEDLEKFKHIGGRKRRIYCAMQHCLDQNIGRLLEHLDEKNLLEDTLIVFASDNGGPCSSNASINAPLRGQKSTFLEGGIRVPMIISWPKRVPAGEVYHKPVVALDFVPTMLAAAKVPLDTKTKSAFDGVDLLPYLLGEDDSRPHETLYWRCVLRSSAIRDHDWKLIRLPDRPALLYDLSEDESEQNDLAANHPEVVKQLLKKLYTWELTFETVPTFIGSMHWMRRHLLQYDSEYRLMQP